MSASEIFNNQKLIEEIKSAVSDGEALLRATAGQAGEGVAKLQSSMTANLNSAKKRLINIEEAVVDNARHAAKVTDDYVNHNPWQSALVAGSVGFLIGYLVASRSD